MLFTGLTAEQPLCRAWLDRGQTDDAASVVLCFLYGCRPGTRVRCAQTAPEAQPNNDAPAGKGVASFLAGGALGLGAHEAGHLLANVALGEKPGLRKVDFHGIPFFAITHRSGLAPRREFVISSAGFWVQHAENEWLLDRRPQPAARARAARERASSPSTCSRRWPTPAPHSRGQARRSATRAGWRAPPAIDERWIGALVLAPAVLDAWRYFHPDAKWAAWTSRGVKIGLVVMVVR